MQFNMKIAGQTAAVQALFDSTPQYCRAYLTEESPDFSVTVCPQDLRFEQAQLDEEARQEGFRLRVFTDPFLERAAIQRAFAEHLFPRGTLLLHGSAIAVDGKGYLFTAPSGTGKSTHTRLWRETFGTRSAMINDDKPFVTFAEDAVFICGSPWSGKHGLDSNISVPLQGICILARGPENSIHPIPPAHALPMLQKQAYCPLAPEKYSIFLRMVERLAEVVPLWHMICNQDPQAALVAHNAMSRL